MKNYPAKNKKNAIEFYRMAYLGEPEEAVKLYVGDEYIQHNPLVGDGKQAFIDYFTEMAKQYPNKDIDFVRAVAEEDLVALHTHQTWPDKDEYVTMDFFRFDQWLLWMKMFLSRKMKFLVIKLS